jgi:hypothetical protein
MVREKVFPITLSKELSLAGPISELTIVAKGNGAN